jgi:acetyl esterase
MAKMTASEKVQTAVGRVILGLPDPVVRVLAGKAIARDGRVLDAQSQLCIRVAELVGKEPSYKMTVAAARADLELSGNQLAPIVRDVSAEDRTLGGVRVRVYRPKDRPAHRGALVFFHGGGHAVGSIDSHDAPCRQVAAQTPCTVISVDYRLAPENPFPAGADDATAAFRGAVAEADALGIDRARIAVGGDSAGGNLAAVVALDTRNDDVRPCFQMLIYPVVDLTMSFASVETFAEGFFLERETILWFRGHYLRRDEDRKNPRASPWYAESLSGLPPALVVTAGFDPLRDEGDAYARRLSDSGVAVEHRSYGGLFHGFWNTSGVIREARRAFDEAIASLRAALERGDSVRG